MALRERLGRFPERELIRRWQVHRDRRAQEELVRRFLPAARQLARRYARAHESIDDLTQAATVGLIAAIDRFDLSRETTLSTYAFPTMSGELKRYLRNTRWGVHMPRGMQERTLDVRRANEQLSATLDRSPTPAELGGALSLSVEEVLEALLAEGARDPASLEAPRHDEEETSSLGDTVGASDAGFDLIEDRSAVIGALRTLPERERRIIELRFGSEMTQSEIARHVGVSQMQVSRLMRRAIGRMRIVATGDDAGSLEETGAS
ncbi:MAG: SigB/SigF/SigG family RNA polymerase sigma factor [Solirubrobacteraceae bacterium]